MYGIIYLIDGENQITPPAFVMFTLGRKSILIFPSPPPNPTLRLMMMNIYKEAVPLTLSKSTKLISLDSLQKRCVSTLCSWVFPPVVSHKQLSYGSKKILIPNLINFHETKAVAPNRTMRFLTRL